MTEDEAANLRFSAFARAEIMAECGGDPAALDDTSVMAVQRRVREQYTASQKFYIWDRFDGASGFDKCGEYGTVSGGVQKDMASVKFVAVSQPLSGILHYVTNREKTTRRLISGVNCVAESAYEEFTATKLQFHKTGGRAYYHIVQAFAPDDPLDFDTAHLCLEKKP